MHEKLDIQEDYFRIICSELRHTTAEIYFNDINQNYIIVIDEKLKFGPLNKAQLGALKHAVEDAASQNGRHGRV